MPIIAEEISKERVEQDKRWTNESDDKNNCPFTWMAVIAETSSSWMVGQVSPFPKETVDSFRKAMLQTAAVAVAAIESIDRQRETNGSAFFEAKSDLTRPLFIPIGPSVAPDFAKEIAAAVNNLYANTSPDNHELVDTLRDDIAASLANAGCINTSDFNDLARTKRN